MPVIENKFRIGERVKYRELGMQPAGTGVVDSIFGHAERLIYRVIPDQRGVCNALLNEDDMEPCGD